MRRATAAALGTVFGTALLVAAKYGTPSATAGAPTAITAGDPAGDGTGAAAGSAPPGVSSSAAQPGTSGTSAASATTSGAARTTAPPQPGRTTPAGGAGPTTAPPPPPTCSTFSGAGKNVPQPGIGTIVVTIKVCNGVISSASSTQSQSNWSRNSAALPALNSLTPQYYKTNISAIHYSNATLTSETYQLSLKDAMTQAHI
jgi:hypothetical protein